METAEAITDLESMIDNTEVLISKHITTKTIGLNEETFNLYKADGWHIFPLYRTKDGKGNAVKGRYATPKGWNNPEHKTYKWIPNTIYGGTPPYGLVAVDWDVKRGKVGKESFEQLQADIGMQLDTQVITPSGGGHSYTRFNGDNLRKAQDKYPDIDFQSHLKEFVVLGGQTVEGYGTYKFTDELGVNYYVNEDIDLSTLETRDSKKGVVEYDGIPTETSERALQLLQYIDPCLDEPEWFKICAILKREVVDGFRVFDEWSQGCSDKYDAASVLSKWNSTNGNEEGATFASIVHMASKNKKVIYMERVARCINLDEVKAVFDKEWSQKPQLKKDMIETMAKTVKKKISELQGSTYSINNARAIVKIGEADPLHEEIQKALYTDVFAWGEIYYVTIENKKSDALRGEESVRKYLKRENIKHKDLIANIMKNIINIRGTETRVDYTQKESIKISVEEDRLGFTDPLLVFNINPVYSLKNLGLQCDPAIVGDFMDGTWNGHLEGFIKLSALTMRFKDKKRLLMLIAPSSVGKTKIVSPFGAVPVPNNTFLTAIKGGGKGLSPAIGAKISKSAIIAINEMDGYLPTEYKELTDDVVNIGLFGGTSTGGMEIELGAVFFTATHTKVLSNVNREYANRISAMILEDSDIGQKPEQSKYYLVDAEKYEKHTLAYISQRIHHYITDEQYTRTDLKKLQKEYAVNTSTEEAEKMIISNILKLASEMAEDEDNKTAKFYDTDVPYLTANAIDDFRLMAIRVAGEYDVGHPKRLADKIIEETFDKSVPKRKKVFGKYGHPVRDDVLFLSN